MNAKLAVSTPLVWIVEVVLAEVGDAIVFVGAELVQLTKTYPGFGVAAIDITVPEVMFDIGTLGTVDPPPGGDTAKHTVKLVENAHAAPPPLVTVVVVVTVEVIVELSVVVWVIVEVTVLVIVEVIVLVIVLVKLIVVVIVEVIVLVKVVVVTTGFSTKEETVIAL